MEYPEEIYVSRATANGRYHGIPNALSERAYRLGYEAGKAAQADPLAGYSNLTAAIKAGEPIDWERLDGLKVQCVNPEVGTLRGEMERVYLYYPFTSSAWWKDDSDSNYISAFNHAWRGEDGWTLWVEGEIPLTTVTTADQLEIGTYFLGEAPSGETDLVYVGGCSEASKVIYYVSAMLKSGTPAYGWVVLEEYGPFIKPESN